LIADNLINGLFGNPVEILENSANAYRGLGADPIAASFAIHPMLDAYVWQNLHGSAELDLPPSALVPVTGEPQSTERWFRRDHPQDEALLGTLRTGFPTEQGESDLRWDISEEFHELLCAANDELEALLPEVWPSTRPFVVRVFDLNSARINSATLDDTGGAVLISDPRLRQDIGAPERIIEVAEGLLHEAAHCKSYRIFRSFSRPSVPYSPEFIDIPWWRTSDSSWAWDVDRAIVGCHVYTHLAHFYARVAELHEGYGKRARTTAFRAKYLANILLQLDDRWLDEDWHGFVEWVVSAIPAVEGLNASGREALTRRVEDFSGFPVSRQ